MSALSIATLFPLDTVAAGDEANGPALVRRARQRGIEASHTTVNRPGALPPAQLYLLAGEGLVGVDDLVAHLRATDLVERVSSGLATLLAVDAGLAALGRTWIDAAGATHAGLGLIGTTARARPGAARTVLTRPEPELGLPAMIGWHSHDFELNRDPGVRHLTALATVDPDEPTPDGVLAPGVVGTQLHGPVVALNPELADLLLARALGVPGWDPLPIPSIEIARARRLAELTGQQYRPRGALAVRARLRRPGTAVGPDNRRGDAAPVPLGGDRGQEA